MLPSVVPRLTTDSAVRVLPGVWKLLFFKTPFPGWISVPTSFVSLFIFHIFSYLLLMTMGCFSGCLMSSAGIQKLFCGIYSVFKCSFDEFVGEKVISPSYSSTILRLQNLTILKQYLCKYCLDKLKRLPDISPAKLGLFKVSRKLQSCASHMQIPTW